MKTIEEISKEMNELNKEIAFEQKRIRDLKREIEKVEDVLVGLRIQESKLKEAFEKAKANLL